MTALAKKFFTPIEYLRLEERSDTKHEYRNGFIVPMAGFDLYRPLKSLQAYVLIDSEQPHIDYFQKRADGKWELLEFSDLTEQFVLPLLGIKMPLKEIYDTVDWLPKAARKIKRRRA